MQFAAQDREVFLNYQLLTIFLLVLFLLVLVFVRHKQSNNSDKQSAHASKSGRTSAAHTASSEDGNDWIEKVNQTVSNADNQDWEWGGSGSNDATASVSAQEVDPLTEYQVYKQFGYESKAAESLAGYLNTLEDGAPEKLVHELIGLNLRVGNIDMLADTLERHIAFENDSVERIVVPGMGNRAPIVLGKKDFGEISPEEMGAVIGFAKPERSAKILKDKISYETALHQYNKAIQTSAKPAGLIIDALRLDYQNEEVGQFAKHLWKLYHSLGQYGRQVKERMLGWGYSLGYHEIFDDLEKGPSEQQIKEIGLKRGYIQPSSLQMKAKYRELVQKDSSVISASSSPADEAVKEVESLLAYGQLDLAIGTLEQAVLQYPQESQLYIILFDLYERVEDWGRLEQFLRLLRERVVSLPEEVVLAMSRLLQRMNQYSKK